MSNPQSQQAKLRARQRNRQKHHNEYQKRKRKQRTSNQEPSKRARTAQPANSSSNQKPNKHTVSKSDRATKTVKKASKKLNSATKTFKKENETSKEHASPNTSPIPPSPSSTTSSMLVHGRSPDPTTTNSPLHTLPCGSLHPGTTTLAIGLGAGSAERKQHVHRICDALKGMEKREGLKGVVLRPESFLAVKFGSVAQRDLAGRMMGESLGRRGPRKSSVGASSDAEADSALGKLKEVSNVIQGLVDEVAALRLMLLAYGMEAGKMKEVLELVMAGVKPDLAIFI